MNNIFLFIKVSIALTISFFNFKTYSDNYQDTKTYIYCVNEKNEREMLFEDNGTELFTVDGSWVSVGVSLKEYKVNFEFVSFDLSFDNINDTYSFISETKGRCKKNYGNEFKYIQPINPEIEGAWNIFSNSRNDIFIAGILNLSFIENEFSKIPFQFNFRKKTPKKVHFNVQPSSIINSKDLKKMLISEFNLKN